MTIRTKEQTANFLTHLGGLAGSVVFSIWLLFFVAIQAGAVMTVSALIFCASMITLYSASSLYHAAKNEDLKKKLKIFDHCAIFTLIAGSYTPFLLVGLKGAWGWSLFGVIWGLAIAGILYKLLFAGKSKLVSTLLYIGMGWLVIIAAKPMSRSLLPSTIIWLAVGGIAYTLGTVFYLNKKIPYTHAIWHMFVMLGTAAHGVAVTTLA